MSARLTDLAPLEPDLVFLQECHPHATLPLVGQSCHREVNTAKGVAIAAPTGRFRSSALPGRPAASAACLAVRVDGSEQFHVVGIWAQQEKGYVRDVIDSVRAHEELFETGPVIVLGDFNSGCDLRKSTSLSPRHRELVATMEGTFDLVSAYHHAHGIAHGRERHATYLHQFRPTQPWHIDFCFVPRRWADRIVNVQVGGVDECPRASDHRPVTVTIASSPSNAATP